MPALQKVVLIGGFAASRSLREYLASHLRAFNERKDCDITLLVPEDYTFVLWISSPESVTDNTSVVNAVAAGAVLRALNKSDGPKRIGQSSYGIIRSEVWMDYPEHKDQRVDESAWDGELYVMRTILWVMKLVSSILGLVRI